MKGITPIISIIVLLLITISLAGAAYFFLTSYTSNLTGQALSVSGICQAGSIARISVANMGTNSIDLGACTGPGAVSGDETTCGDITIVSMDGHTMDGNWSATSIGIQTGNNPESATFRDYACSGFCQYAFTRSGEMQPVTTSVRC
jgi:flagellin-like protein